MTEGWFSAASVERARHAAHSIADVTAFILESAFIGNSLFWLLTWGLLSFNWDFTAHEYGRFWSHYAQATPAARHPVELGALTVLIALSAFAAWTRLARAKPGWTPWPYARAGRATRSAEATGS